jgi:hypothetical protein
VRYLRPQPAPAVALSDSQPRPLQSYMLDQCLLDLNVIEAEGGKVLDGPRLVVDADAESTSAGCGFQQGSLHGSRDLLAVDSTTHSTCSV